jgi:hypothetical protein
VLLFTVLAHWAEHLVQAYQVWVLDRPRPAARGALGQLVPWLATSEWLHYGYALVMIIGLVLLQPGFGRALGNWGTRMTDRHADVLTRLEARLRAGPGELSPQTRAAAIDADPLPDPLAQAYVETIRRHAYKLTDRRLEELAEADWSDDQIFELTVAAAFGVAKRRLDAGLAALDAAGPRPSAGEG